MANNREWLKSLSAKALAEEIKYGRLLVEFGHHRDHCQKELDEAIQEHRARSALHPEGKPDHE